MILSPAASSFVTVSFYDPPFPPTSGVFPRAREQRAAGGRAGSPGETESAAQAQPAAAPQPPVPSPEPAADPEGTSTARPPPSGPQPTAGPPTHSSNCYQSQLYARHVI